MPDILFFDETDGFIDSHPDEYQGPLKNRSCTDVICLLIFIVFVVLWAVIGIWGFRNGDPNTLLVPKDSSGLRCGLDEEVKSYKYLFFFDLTECLAASTPFTGCSTKQVCVESCPNATFYYETSSKNLQALPYCNYKVRTTAYDENECPKWFLPSTSLLNRCVSNVVDRKDNQWKLPFVQTDEIYRFNQNLNPVRMWLNLAVHNGVTIVKDDENIHKLSSSANTKQNIFLALFIIVAIVLGNVLLVLIFLRSRIVLAIALIKEGSRAVSSVTSVLFFPVFPWILQGGIIAYAVIAGVYLASSGEPLYQYGNVTDECQTDSNHSITANTVCSPKNLPTSGSCSSVTCSFIGIKNDAYYSYLQGINIFGFFWLAFFVSAFGQMTLAQVFAQWYWTRPKRDLPFFALTAAIYRTIRYHLGTLAFGSLIIAICRMIRVMLECVDKKLKKYDNAFTRAILCCLKCFFWCLEKFLKFINKNAYIMCAIHGKNFCASAKDAFTLLLNNIVRVFVLDKVTDFLFFLSKLLVTFGVGAIAYVFFVTDYISFVDNSEIQYGLAPVVAIIIATYLIATLFFNVYSMAVDTLFLCFLEDSEKNNGKDRPYYMSRNLMRILGKRNKPVCVESCPNATFYYETSSKNLQALPYCNYKVRTTAYDENECPKWFLPSTSLLNRCVSNVVDRKDNQWKLPFVQTDEIYRFNQNLNPVRMWLNLAVHNGVTIVKDDENIHKLSSSANTKQNIFLALFIIVAIVLGNVLLVLIFLRSRIVLAIALIKEGSRAVSSVTSVLFFPVFPWILQGGIIAYAVIAGVYLASSGEPLYQYGNVTDECQTDSNHSITANTVCSPKNLPTSGSCSSVTCSFIGIKNDAYYSYLQGINIFGFFWLAFFVSAFGQMTLAQVFAQWYWTRPKRDLPFFALTAAIYRTIRYHLGTLAFGSLIIAICRMIRVMLEYVDKKLKKYDNAFTRAILCCLKCFFWCLEKFLKFINKNAYIMCAIHGKNFCASAKDAFTLLLNNIVRVFVLDKVTDFLFFLSKLLVTFGVGAIAYVFFVTDYISFVDNSEIQYGLAPVVAIMIATYLIATLFFNVYSMAVDTLFLCFLEDSEKNNGKDRPYYMSRNLMRILGKRNKPVKTD
ncbi:hypothetical protein HUJ04_010436 [Dendroctonus ponderosae]|nr:hypothetical protein HUJ04_010436 [Dendroctonus ponderosae]